MERERFWSMRNPWVNTLLLLLLAGAFVSGFLGLTNGDPDRRWLMWSHSTFGFAVATVLVWKSGVVMDSLRRQRGMSLARVAFLLSALLLLAVLATAVVWGLAGRISLLGYSLVTLHVLLAAALVAPLLWHTVAMRRVLSPRAVAGDRRAFLRLAGATAAGFALWQASGLAYRLLSLPGAARRFTGSYETGSFTGRFPTVSWLFDRPAPVETGGWRLEVVGAVRRPLQLTYGDLQRMAAHSATETLDCTGGWYTIQEWSGVRLSALLERAGLSEEAESVTVRSVSGYDRRFSLGEARRGLLALNVAERPLTHGHGAPLRLVMPDHRGFDWVKWVDRITVNTSGDFWQRPLPTQ